MAATSALLAATVSPAQADGTQYWSISYQAGNASGKMTSNVTANYWHVSGKITDSKSNTSCSYFRVRIYLSTWGWHETNRRTVCGGATASFDFQGYAERDSIQISVCSKLAGFSDICSNKTMYLT